MQNRFFTVEIQNGCVQFLLFEMGMECGLCTIALWKIFKIGFTVYGTNPNNSYNGCKFKIPFFEIF